MEQEIPKYKKKKESNTSKSKSKSNHKHKYHKCLLIHNGYPVVGEVCSICGKIYNIHFHETEETEDHFYRQLDADEVFEKYKELPKYEIVDIFQKYVAVE